MTADIEILKKLSEYTGGADPHGQLDQCVVDKCKELSEKKDLKSQDIKDLLDACVYASLCTDFVIMLLDRQWKILIEEERIQSAKL